jgi:hypothetical protein
VPSSNFDRSWIDRPAPNHPLVGQLAGRMAELAIDGDPEVARIVLAAYRVASAGGSWDPEGGTTTLDRATVDRAVRLGQLLAHAGMADYEHRIAPGPVVGFTGGSLVLDLRFGDPEDDGRAVEAIALGFEELGLTLGEGVGRGTLISGGS